MKEGFIFGLLTALAVSVPVMLSDHMAYRHANFLKENENEV